MASTSSLHDWTQDLNEKEKEAFAVFSQLVQSKKLPAAYVAPGEDAYKNEVAKDTTELVLEEREVKFLEPSCLLRYLRARNFVLTRSVKMLKETLEWRRREDIYNLSITTHKFIETALARGNMYVSGKDRAGRPLIYLRPNINHDPHPGHERLLYMTWAMEMAFRTMGPGVHQMTWICSLDGYTMKHNGDLKFSKELLTILQGHNPERLAHAFFLDVPFLFRMAWKAVSPFVDDRTKSKVHFVDTATRSEYLSKYIDLDVLEACFGGKNKYRFNHLEYAKRMLDLEGKPQSSFKSVFGPEGPPPPVYCKTATNDIDESEAQLAREKLARESMQQEASGQVDEEELRAASAAGDDEEHGHHHHHHHHHLHQQQQHEGSKHQNEVDHAHHGHGHHHHQEHR